MTIDQLKYLLMINQCRSITQAAQQLHISHQALSASIKSLEKELDTTLLDKTARGTTLTHKGKQLVEISADFIQALNSIFRSKMSTPLKYSLRIAASYLSITNYLATKLSSQAALPYTIEPIWLEYVETADIIKAVRQNFADIGVVALFHPPSTGPQPDFSQFFPDMLDYHTITTLKIFCEVHNSHPLAYLEEIPFSRLQKYPLCYFYPRLYTQVEEEANNKLLNNPAFIFSRFFHQFDFTIESNPTLYTYALQNKAAIGITIAETSATFYGHQRIPLQSDCFFELYALRLFKENYSPAEDFIFYG